MNIKVRASKEFDVNYTVNKERTNVFYTLLSDEDFVEGKFTNTANFFTKRINDMYSYIKKVAVRYSEDEQIRKYLRLYKKNLLDLERLLFFYPLDETTCTLKKDEGLAMYYPYTKVEEEDFTLFVEFIKTFCDKEEGMNNIFKETKLSRLFCLTTDLMTQFESFNQCYVTDRLEKTPKLLEKIHLAHVNPNDIEIYEVFIKTDNTMDRILDDVYRQQKFLFMTIYKDLSSEWRQTEIGLFSKTYGYIKTYVVLNKTVSNNPLSCLGF